MALWPLVGRMSVDPLEATIPERTPWSGMILGLAGWSDRRAHEEHISMHATTRSMRWFPLLVAGLLGCGPARGLAADSAGGVANWFETVAEAERLAEAEADKRHTPAPAPAPIPVPPPGGNEPPPRPVVVVDRPLAADVNALRALIEQRDRQVNGGLFTTVRKLTVGRRPTQDELQALRDWFTTYFQMRALMPASRKDPNLAAVTKILEEAVRRRTDFVEGRILLASCLLYAGRPNEARTQLEEASRFLHDRSLNPSPFGLDCCGGWLRLGEPDRVARFIMDLKNKRIVPEHKLTAVQALLVAVHSWQTFRFGEAKEYFEKSLRKARAFDKAPVSPGVQGLLADAALFYLVAGSEGARNVARGEMLLEKIPDANRSWAVRRARAALNASKAATADAADAAGFWDAAIGELEACRQESLPTLDTEIDEQLANYRNRELWLRERAKPPAKADGARAGDD